MEQAEYPEVGEVLWGVDIELAKDVFRSGGATTPNTNYLRYVDLHVSDKVGRLTEEDMTLSMTQGQGISMFLKQEIPKGFIRYEDEAAWKEAVTKKKRKKLHWWTLRKGQPLPSGLQLVYDGQPPGHCTLTVTRDMTVKCFLALVSNLTFDNLGFDMLGPATQ